MKTITLIISLIISLSFLAQKEELISDLNTSNFNLDFSNYNQSTSIYCSQLSEIAYLNSSKLEKVYEKIKKQYPNDNYQYELIKHKKSHTEALLWGNKYFLVIAFRGTEPSKVRDWFTDAKFWNYENNPNSNEELANMPAGHGGFRKALIKLIQDERLFEKIDQMIVKCDPAAIKTQFPIYLTGHSLGAAISQLFIEPLNYKEYNFSGAYHFAPPLAVTCQLNDYMKTKYGNMVYDIVNYKDYVPRAGRNGVAHFGKFYRICKDGLMYTEKEAFIKFKFFEYPSEFRLHSLKNHLKAIKNDDNSPSRIKERSEGKDYPCLAPKNVIVYCK